MKFFSLLLFSLNLFSYSGWAITASEKKASIKCMNWVLEQYPEIKKRATYLPEENILIEKIGEEPNTIRVIHTETGTLVSVDKGKNEKNKEKFICTPEPAKFDSRPMHGIYSFITLALNTRLQYLKTAPEGGVLENFKETKAALNFIKKIPKSCIKADPRIRGNVNHYCTYLKDTNARYAKQAEVCR